MKNSRFVLAALLVCLLGACGQKGPLYVPEDTNNHHTTEG